MDARVGPHRDPAGAPDAPGGSAAPPPRARQRLKPEGPARAYRTAVELGLYTTAHLAEGIGHPIDALERRQIERYRKIGYPVKDAVAQLVVDRLWLKQHGRSA